MEMEQLVKGARRPAPRALPTRHRAERTLGEESHLGWIKDKEQNSRGGQSQPNSGGNCTLPGFIGGRVNKMKIRHDLKTFTE